MTSVENRFYVLGLSRSVGIAFFLEYEKTAEVVHGSERRLELAYVKHHTQIDPGFSQDHVLTFPVNAPNTYLGEPVSFSHDDVLYSPQGVVMPMRPMSVNYSGVSRFGAPFVLSDIDALFIFSPDQPALPGHKQIYTVFDEFQAGCIFDQRVDDSKSKGHTHIESFSGIATAAARMREKLTQALSQVAEFESRAASMNFTDPQQPVQLYWDEIDKEMVMFSEGATAQVELDVLDEALKDTIINNLHKHESQLRKS